IAAPDIKDFVDRQHADQHYWPAPLIQLNPSFVRGKTVEALVAEGALEPECARIFRLGKGPDVAGETLGLHLHQEEAVRIAQTGKSYVLTTGTGSGKSLSYFIPIVSVTTFAGSSVVPNRRLATAATARRRFVSTSSSPAAGMSSARSSPLA